MGGGGAPSTTTSRQELPEYAQPVSQEVLGRGLYLSNQPYQSYGGEFVAPEQR